MVASKPLTSIPRIPRQPRLQRCYLFVVVSVIASVLYFSSAKAHSAPDILAHLHKDLVTRSSRASGPPNLVLVLTDDQDSMLQGASHMPQTLELVAAKGAVLSNAFVANPLCCPSRASILTGRYVHNHGTWNNSIEGGCSNEDWQNGPEKEAFNVHLQAAGYNTFFAGKYLNKYAFPNVGGVAHVPPGWSTWYGLQGNSRYYNYIISVNGTEEPHGTDPTNDYLTRVIWQKAKAFLDTFTPADVDSDQESNQLTEPFFMMLSTPAAHSPYTPEPKYANNFTEIEAPRTASFNVENDNTKHWMLRLAPQNMTDDVIAEVDEIFRDRLRTLLTVDDMVADVIATLEEKGLLNNTYVVFTSDNGYHLGQFSMPVDKRQPYEFDIRVPLMVRGPGIAEGTVIPYATVNVDLGPTLLDLAGAAIPDYMDGVSLKTVLLQNSAAQEWNSEPSEREDDSYSSNSRSAAVVAERTMLIEHFGEGRTWENSTCQELGTGVFDCRPNFDCKCSDASNNTYACVRQFFIPSPNYEGTTSGPNQLNHYQIEELTEESLVAGAEDLQPDGLVTLGSGNQYPGMDVTPIKDVIFCEWEDDEMFVEYYDLSIDSDQLYNTASELSDEVLAEYKSLLASLKECQGESCRVPGGVL